MEFESDDLIPENNDTGLHQVCNSKTPEPPIRLTDYSPKDKPWNRHRSHADDVQSIYSKAFDFEKLADRISECSGYLGFQQIVDKSTGELSLKLKRAFFCRVRYCPVCQWRRSLMWQARFYQALPQIVETFPKSRWVFLTLTVRNCEIDELSDTLKSMSKAWNKFIKRADLRPVEGWIRTTEVTRGKDRSAHPHFHCLMMVKPSWFQGKYYVKQSRFVELWQESLKANYAPNVDVRVVKPKKNKKADTSQSETEQVIEMLRGAVSETLKYAVKPADFKSDSQWFIEMTRQTHKKRFLATGGALKDILKPEEETNEDLLKTGNDDDSEDDTDDLNLLGFEWNKKQKEYHRSKAK